MKRRQANKIVARWLNGAKYRRTTIDRALRLSDIPACFEILARTVEPIVRSLREFAASLNDAAQMSFHVNAEAQKTANFAQNTRNPHVGPLR